MNTRKTAFTLVEIMIVVSIIGLLAAIAIPNFVAARTASQRNACVANLKEMERVKTTFKWEVVEGRSNAGFPMPPNMNCPAGGTYTFGNQHARATCSHRSAGDKPDHILE